MRRVGRMGRVRQKISSPRFSEVALIVRFRVTRHFLHHFPGYTLRPHNFMNRRLTEASYALEDYLYAGMPVTRSPMISVWMLWVPS